MANLETEINTKLTEKGLGASSIKLYLRNLKKLNEGKPIKDFKFLSNIEDTMKKLEDLKPNTKRAYLITIVSTLNCFLKNKQTTAMCNKYYALMKDTSNKIKETPTTEMSKEQNDNWIDWTEVTAKYHELKDKSQLISKKKELSPAEYNTLLSFIILSLYVSIPPRRNMDWTMMKLKKKVIDSDDKKFNYLDFDANKFIFNVYKTASTYNEQDLPIPDQLKTDLTLYLKHHPSLKNGKITKDTNVMLLEYQDGKDLKSINSITRILNKVFDKKIGSSMLRHIFITDKFGKQKEEQSKVASEMGHSVQTQGEYIKDDKNVKK